METIKQIPQAFFDLIARVSPGTVAIILFLYVIPGLSWKQFLTWISAGLLNGDNVLGFSIIVFLVFGYAVGHIVAPLGKLISRLPFLEKPEEHWKAYDWLRVHQPEICKTPVRIRAEYTMHFSLSAVFLICVLLILFFSILNRIPIGWLQLAVFAILGGVAMFRGAEVRKIFWVSVHNLKNEASSLSAASNELASSKSPTKRTENSE